MHLPLVNKLKRKREDDAQLHLHRLDQSAPAAQTAKLSHVQVPALVRQNPAPAADLSPIHDVSPSPSSRTHPATLPLAKVPTTGTASDPAKHDCTPSAPLPGRLPNHRQKTTIPGPKAVPSEASLRRIVESQFGLDILLKHKELRLIDQEIAKCQAALEQLRRCSVIPYPAVSSQVSDMEMVSDGSGPVYGNTAPQAPAWGVVNGPYTRHYDRWLLQDSVFDASFSDPSQPPEPARTAIPEQSSRSYKSAKRSVVSTSRSHRGSSHAHLAAIPAGYPEPSKEKGPIIVKRRSDGKMVKLVCLECRRSDFNSLQGFVNHCRIAHARTFKSHDAAIEASGEEVNDGAEAVSGESVTVQPSLSHASAGLVHPLVRSALVLGPSPLTNAPPQAPFRSTAKKTPQKPGPSTREQHRTDLVTTLVACPKPHDSNEGPTPCNDPVPEKLTPSARTPHLSAFLAKLGRGGDLAGLVAEVTAEPPAIDPLDEEDDNEDQIEDAEPQITVSHEVGSPPSRSTRGIIRDPVPPPVRTSQQPSPTSPYDAVGCEDTPTTSAFSHPSAYPAHFGMDDHDWSQTSLATPVNLSPNTTDPHPAPSLVSDDGDYDGAHSDYESPSESGDHREAHHYLDAEVMDHDHLDLSVGHSGCSLAPHAGQPSGKPHHHDPVPRSRPSTATYANGAMESRHGERHVSFASPARTIRERPASAHDS